MKAPSDKLRALITLFHQSPSLADRLLGKRRWSGEIIEQIHACGEPAAIPYLFPVLHSKDHSEVLEAARAINSLVSGVAIGDLVSLDEMMRRGWWYDESWKKLEPRALATWVGPGDPGNLLLRLSSMHPNGYVREEAVRRLALIGDGSELRYLLLRLHDWVAPVRNAAARAIVDRTRSDYAGHFVESLALLLRLRGMQRGDHGTVIEGVHQLLASPVARNEMIGNLRSDSKEIRRGSFGIFKSVTPRLQPDILRASLASEDAVIRLWVTRELHHSFDQEELLVLLTTLSHDQSPAVRAAALESLVSEFPDQAVEFLQSSLLDKSGSLRAKSRFWFAKRTALDLRRFYLDAVESAKTAVLPTAIAGLAEMGKRDDAEIIGKYLNHAVPAVRKAAVAYVLRLGGESYIDRVVAKIWDASEGVSKQARLVALPYVYHLGVDRLRALLAQEDLPLHARRNLFRLSAALSKWDAISFFLRELHNNDAQMASEAQNYLDRWNSQYNKSFTTPTDEQWTTLAAAYQDNDSSIPSWITEHLHFSTHSFRPSARAATIKQ